MKSSLAATTICSLFSILSGTMSHADSVERHWEFESVKSVAVAGRDIRIVADDVPRVTLSCLDSAFTPDEFSPSGNVTNGLLTIVAPSVERESAKWTLRVPRKLKLDLITGSCSGEVRIQNIHASYLRMETERQYLRLDDCDIDSLKFSSKERNMDITSGVIRYWAMIKTPRTIHVTLRRLPDDLFYFDTWSVELFLEELGESYCFEIPDAGGKDISSSFLKCSHEKIPNPDSLELPNTLYCISRKGTGWPKVIGSPAIEHFFCPLPPVGSSGAREFHKRWTFDSISSLSIQGDNVKILADNSSVVRVSFTDTISSCEEDHATATLKGTVLELASGHNAMGGIWLVRVPRWRTLEHINCSIMYSCTVQGISAGLLSARSWHGGLSVNSCALDSLFFDSGEGSFSSSSTTVEHCAKIICQSPITLKLDRPPSDYLQCFTEILTLEFKTLGKGLYIEMPNDDRGQHCTPDRPYPCDSVVKRQGWPRNDSWSDFCRSTAGEGGPIIFIGAELCYFKFIVGGKSY